MIAALPMYDFPGLRAAHDEFWAAVAARLRLNGVKDVPDRLTRGTNPRALWRHPSLLLAQACEYPISQSGSVPPVLVATPRYSAQGCEGARYRSAIVVRAEESAESLAAFRGTRCVINETDSNSGVNLLRAEIAPLAGGRSFFRAVTVSGSHRESLKRIVTHAADIGAIDCVTLAYLRRLEPDLTGRVRVLSWTASSPSLPFVTARSTNASTLEALRASLDAAVRSPGLAGIREQLLLEGFDLMPDPQLREVRKLERDARDLQYPVLC